MDPEGFRPVPWLPGRHLQTVWPVLLPVAPLDGRQEHRLVEVEPGSQLRLDVAWPREAPRGTLVVVHGLGGSSASGQVLRMAGMALQAGWVAVRVNLRNCGGTESLCRTLYNAGQSEDVGRILESLDAERFPRPFALVGFSLGGNLTLRYAGRGGAQCLADAVIGINPPICLESCVAALEQPRNLAYHAYFTAALCRQLRRIRRVRPVPGPEPHVWRIRSVRRFDTHYTAPDGGYPSAEAYYLEASAAPYLEGLRVPATILCARNDPFVPHEIFPRHAQAPPGTLRLIAPSRGGHGGYWHAARPRFWAATLVLELLPAAIPRRSGA